MLEKYGKMKTKAEKQYHRMLDIISTCFELLQRLFQFIVSEI